MSLSLLLSQKATGLIISVSDFYFLCGLLRIYELLEFKLGFRNIQEKLEKIFCYVLNKMIFTA